MCIYLSLPQRALSLKDDMSFFFYRKWFHFFWVFLPLFSWLVLNRRWIKYIKLLKRFSISQHLSTPSIHIFFFLCSILEEFPWLYLPFNSLIWFSVMSTLPFILFIYWSFKKVLSTKIFISMSSIGFFFFFCYGVV